MSRCYLFRGLNHHASLRLLLFIIIQPIIKLHFNIFYNHPKTLCRENHTNQRCLLKWSTPFLFLHNLEPWILRCLVYSKMSSRCLPKFISVSSLSFLLSSYLISLSRDVARYPEPSRKHIHRIFVSFYFFIVVRHD